MKKTGTALCWALLIAGATATQAQAQAQAQARIGFVREFDQSSLARIVGARQGHPFVLVIWSLDCAFCQASLATLSNKKRLHPGLRVVTLATDQLADPPALTMMEKRLTVLGLRSDAWAFGALPPEQLRYAIDRKWRGEMPRSYWFDAHGSARAQSGVITADQVDQFLASH
jgi:hypothetical protein